jgi:hypothetical protein
MQCSHIGLALRGSFQNYNVKRNKDKTVSRISYVDVTRFTRSTSRQGQPVGRGPSIVRHHVRSPLVASKLTTLRMLGCKYFRSKSTYFTRLRVLTTTRPANTTHRYVLTVVDWRNSGVQTSGKLHMIYCTLKFHRHD